MATVRRPSASWSPPRNILGERSKGGGTGFVEFDGQGRATAAWDIFTSRGTSGGVLVARRSRDGKWSKARRVFGLGFGLAAADVNTRGDAVVVASGGSGLFGATRSARGIWRRPQKVPTSGADRVGGAAAALGADGTAIAGWIEFAPAPPPQPRTDETLVQTSIMRSNGTWSQAVTLARVPDGDGVQLAVDRAGTAFASWEGRTAGGLLAVQTATRSPGGSRTPAQTISPAELSSSRPQIGVDGRGNATVAFESRRIAFDITDYNDQTVAAVWATTRPASGDWQEPQPVSATGFAPTFTFSVSDSGGALLAWYDQQKEQQESPAPAVFAIARSPSGVWGSKQRLGGPAQMDSRNRPPGAALNARGDAVVTWVFGGKRVAAVTRFTP